MLGSRLYLALLVSLACIALDAAQAAAATPARARSSPLRLSSSLDAPEQAQLDMQRANKRADRAALLEADADKTDTSDDDEQPVKRGDHKHKKRCTYIGTFFHRIDCNAPVNSTSIPYAPAEPAATSSK
ncbi:uncharacterized protein JCM10292_007654 [Rhodotorula paludigena]|uniref:uncharacterized protein n=1 Tax=Rhodotorula paludigena TaxID=86838 RepID=UPI00317D310C